jgi:hypothetical protein
MLHAKIPSRKKIRKLSAKEGVRLNENELDEDPAAVCVRVKPLEVMEPLGLLLDTIVVIEEIAKDSETLEAVPASELH